MPEYVNKVIFGNDTLIDLTADTVTAADLASGVTAHDASGAPITGSCTKDVDSSGATAAVGEVLATKTFAARGALLTGTMPNIGAVNGTISDKNTPYSIPTGFHDGGGTVSLDLTESAKLIPANIKSGVSLFGVTGSYNGEGVTAQTKSVTPAVTQQVILPDSGYDYLSQVTVAAIPFVSTPNAAGGNTVTIG